MRDILQFRSVLSRWSTAVEHRIDLGENTRAHSQVTREHHPGPHKRERGRIVAGRHDGEHLVAKLTISHRASCFILHTKQRAEQVHEFGRPEYLSTLANDAVHQRVETANCCRIAQIARCWDSVWYEHHEAEQSRAKMRSH